MNIFKTDNNAFKHTHNRARIMSDNKNKKKQACFRITTKICTRIELKVHNKMSRIHLQTRTKEIDNFNFLFNIFVKCKFPPPFPK